MRLRRPAVAASVVVVVALGAFLVPSVLPGVLPDVRGKLPWFGTPDCPQTVLEAVAAPTIASAVTSAVAGVQGRELPDETCLRVEVRGQEPSDTVAGSGVLPVASAPQLWVSDSSLWTSRVETWRLQQAGSFGSTPVALVTNAATATQLGWSTTPPSWTAALDGSRPVAAPQLTTSAAALLAMQALWQAGGQGDAAERLLAAALLSVGRTPAESEQAALRAAEHGQASQPLIPTTEQAMRTVNLDSSEANLVAVYPSEGSPMLDFPILRIAPEQQSATANAAVDVVVAALTPPTGRAAARAAGLRDPDGRNPPPEITTPTVRRLIALPTAEQAAFLARLATLAAPSRLLVVVDVSLSMRTTVPGTGLSRLELAGRAAAAAGDLLTNSSSVGLWVFSRDLDGKKPYRQLAPITPLGGANGTVTQREVVTGQLLALDQHVKAGGTALFETARDAVRTLRTGYDPRAVNAVVLFTDGTNENSDEVSLRQVVETLRLEAAAAPNRPVGLVGIGLGPDANMTTLQALSAATGTGAAYRADSPAQLQQVLYEALARRK